MVMPGHGLTRRDLKFRYAEGRPFGMTRSPFYLIKVTRIFERNHDFLLRMLQYIHLKEIGSSRSCFFSSGRIKEMPLHFQEVASYAPYYDGFRGHRVDG